MNLVVTIDGPSGSGKGTTAKGIAAKLGIPHVDSGSIYRALAYFLHEQDIAEQDNARIVEALKDFSLSYNDKREALINGVLVEHEIRTRENSMYAFQYSRNQLLRDLATSIQRDLLSHGGVLDGRDAGSVVAPDAQLKIYLECDVDERTRRRAKQHGITDPEKIAELRAEIIERDTEDMNKGEASLRLLPDSVVVDTSGLSIDEQIEKVYQLALEKINTTQTEQMD